ncbi:MAG: class II aldolase/adducin family protein [Alphaproteobacteria bacterium]|jgi:HCOMODA/2-hydroxy-3-carboxy-muconic semialdehyde decarboxylase|nr:class II aldolase/adducin family protein [Alphaproteobacteria bacterium]
MSGMDFGFLGEPLDRSQSRVRVAARALGNNDLGHAFGHVSARIDAKSFLVCAPKPMGLIEPGETGTIVPVEGPLPDGVLGEVRCHQQIYKRRPDVNGIARTFLRDVMTLSTFQRTPKARIGFASYFAPCPPLWDDPLLLRDDAAAKKFAETLGNARAIVMRGNGCVLTGATVEEAIVMAFFLEEAAKTELAVMASGHEEASVVYSSEQAAARAVSSGRIFERMWDYLTNGDPEA